MDHMRPFPPLRRVLVTTLLCALALPALPPPASAGASTGDPVRTLDARIADAQRRIDQWNRVLVRWQVHVSKAAARLQYATAAAAGTEPVRVPDYLTPRAANHVVRFPLTPHERVVRAHRALQAVLRDHAALEAQQQLQAWGSYLLRLQQARVRAERAASRRASIALPSGPVTYEAWGKAFLRTLGAPTCSDNEVLVVTWETAESTQATYNPLATTHAMPGAGVFNSAGVKDYVSLAQGLAASRDTLEGGADSYAYGAILDALRGCAPAETTAAAIRDSAWCRGCAAGAYVVGLLPVVRAAWDEHAGRLISTPQG